MAIRKIICEQTQKRMKWSENLFRAQWKEKERRKNKVVIAVRVKTEQQSSGGFWFQMWRASLPLTRSHALIPRCR